MLRRESIGRQTGKAAASIAAALIALGLDVPRPAQGQPGPRVAVLATPPEGEETALYLQPIDSATPAAVSARIPHLRGAIVRGAVVPQAAAVAVIADTSPRRDPSWGASLLLVRERAAVLPLLERVYHGTRPLVLPDGRVFVLRGSEGPPPTAADEAAGRLRVDALEITELGFDGRPPRAVYRSKGYIAFLGGALGGEIFVYEVGPDGARLIAVDVDRGDHPVRVLMKSLPAQARDFSVDVQNRALLFSNADPNQPGTSIVQRLDLVRSRDPGAVARPPTTLDRSRAGEVRASAWPGRSTVISKDLEALQVRDARGVLERAPALMPRGINVIRDFFARDQSLWAIALNRAPGARLPRVLAIRADASAAEGETREIATPAGVQLDVAGILAGAAAPAAPAILKEAPVPRRLRLPRAPTRGPRP